MSLSVCFCDLTIASFFIRYLSRKQPEESEKTSSEVSTTTSNSSRLHMSVPNVRKRLNVVHTTNFLSAQPFKQLETVADPKSKSGFKTKIYPTKMNHKLDRSSSRENSDTESDCFTKCEEKSQLICYKDNIKIISLKNDSRLTKYSTFDIDVGDRRGKIVKYKSLDEPESKNLVKYLDPYNKVSISAQDFASDLKFSRIEQRKRNKHDIITETVDAWARKHNNKSMFSNIKNTIFKNGASVEKEIVFKPLVFGGTFPIDRPESDIEREKKNSRVVMNQSPKMREYGPPKTYNIDQPI